jgi:autotransporter-associated beta strand protein
LADNAAGVTRIFDVADVTSSSAADLIVSARLLNSSNAGAATALTKSGAGTLVLSGNNSYTGTTTISVGTLQLGAGGTTGSLNSGSAIVNNGTLAFNRLNTVTQGTDFAAVISGTGALIQAGSGNLILSGANTYTGGTTLSGGLITMNASDALGTTGNITFSGGGLQFSASGTTDVSSRIKNSAAAVLLNTNAQNISFGSAIDGSNTGGLTKNGTGTLILSGNNTYTGATSVNSGTLTAAAGNALANTSQVVLNNGGSFLVTAENAVNDNAAINLNGGRMAMSGTFNETVGALTLSANSTLDFSGFVGTLRFSGIGSWAAGANLAIWNWSGRTEYGTNYGTYPNSSNLVFTNNSTLSSNLANISFYSDSGTTFIGSGFERGFSGGGTEIIAVPETETYFIALALLAGIVVQYLRRRAKRKPLGGSAFALIAPARCPSSHR